MEIDTFINLLGRRPLYHFTDLTNLPSIRQHGLLSLGTLAARGIPVARPGGNQWSHDADRRRGLDGFVHLCLVEQHPMEYQARTNGHIGETRFLQIAPDVVRVAGTLGSALVANRADSIIRPIEEALDEIDLDILFRVRVDFRDDAQRNRYNEAKKSEILIPDAIAVDLIRNLH